MCVGRDLVVTLIEVIATNLVTLRFRGEYLGFISGMIIATPWRGFGQSQPGSTHQLYCTSGSPTDNAVF
jgi:hypothetical protein